MSLRETVTQCCINVRLAHLHCLLRASQFHRGGGPCPNFVELIYTVWPCDDKDSRLTLDFCFCFFFLSVRNDVLKLLLLSNHGSKTQRLIYCHSWQSSKFLPLTFRCTQQMFWHFSLEKQSKKIINHHLHQHTSGGVITIFHVLVFLVFGRLTYMTSWHDLLAHLDVSNYIFSCKASRDNGLLSIFLVFSNRCRGDKQPGSTISTYTDQMQL